MDWVLRHKEWRWSIDLPPEHDKEVSFNRREATVSPPMILLGAKHADEIMVNAPSDEYEAAHKTARGRQTSLCAYATAYTVGCVMQGTLPQYLAHFEALPRFDDKSLTMYLGAILYFASSQRSLGSRCIISRWFSRRVSCPKKKIADVAKPLEMFIATTPRLLAARMHGAWWFQWIRYAREPEVNVCFAPFSSLMTRVLHFRWSRWMHHRPRCAVSFVTCPYNRLKISHIQSTSLRNSVAIVETL